MASYNRAISSSSSFCVIAIGDSIFDLRAAQAAGLFSGEAAGAPDVRPIARATGRVVPDPDAPRLADSVETALRLGEGVVLAIDVDGVVTVRFEDGMERRLMLDYAPLEKIGR